MNTILAWVLKWSGAGWVWDKADGYKTYGAAALGILTSLAGLAVEFAPVLSSHNTAGLLSLIQGLPKDPSWLALIAAVGLLGLKHSQDKAAAPEGIPLPNQSPSIGS